MTDEDQSCCHAYSVSIMWTVQRWIEDQSLQSGLQIISERKSATKFLYMKAVSVKVVRHSLA